MAIGSRFPTLTAEEATELIPHGAMVGSGFTPAGAPGGAQSPRQAGAALHAAGTPFQNPGAQRGFDPGVACDDELRPGRGDQVAGPLHDLRSAAETRQHWPARLRGHAPLTRPPDGHGGIPGPGGLRGHRGYRHHRGWPGLLDDRDRQLAHVSVQGRRRSSSSSMPITRRGSADWPMSIVCRHLRIVIHSKSTIRSIGSAAITEVDPTRYVGVVHTNEPDGGRVFAPPAPSVAGSPATSRSSCSTRWPRGESPPSSCRCKVVWAASAPQSGISPPTRAFRSSRFIRKT